MNELNELLRPVWQPQTWLLDGWSVITQDEKQLITARLDSLFKNGLPFKLNHDKLIYIHLFTWLAQVEVIAIQIPLKFESQLSTPELRQHMRTQLLDEIFHSMVFTKILYLLCEPYSLPPRLSEQVDHLVNLVRFEPCPKVAVAMLNLIAEGWIEELFKCLRKHDFANDVFDVIIEDERRHISEAELYCDIGLPDVTQLALKLESLEDLMLATLFSQYNMGMSLMNLIGVSGMQDFFHSIDKKHIKQLQKLQLTPGDKWRSCMDRLPEMFQHFHQNMPVSYQIPMSPIRKTLMTQWADPVDPTMVGQFNLDVSCLELFNKTYPSETLTTLMLQTISQMLVTYPEYQRYIRNKVVYQRQNARVSLVVKLPGCDDQLGVITFQDCHALSVKALSARIKHVVAMMVYCYQTRAQLDQKYPHLTLIHDNILDEMKHPIYRPVLPIVPGISLSNNGMAGFTQGTSPLLPNESSKITLFEVQRTPVWSKTSQSFEARDLLPVSISVDHRIYGGDFPTPRVMSEVFQDVFHRMDLSEGKVSTVDNERTFIKHKLDGLLADNLELGYMTLMSLQTMWPDYLPLQGLLMIARTTFDKMKRLVVS